MPQTSNRDPALTLYVAGILVTLAAMIVAFGISDSAPVVVLVGADSTATATGGAVPVPVMPVPSVVAPPAAPAAPPALPPTIQVIEVAAVPPAGDPFDPVWDEAPMLEVPLQPQTITRPMLQEVTIKTVRIRAMRDGRQIAWRLDWEAPTPAHNVDAGQFSDGVALQFPLQPNTPFMMGGPGLPVRILHWKALWQRDIDQGYQEVEDLHPNYHADFYWFATGQFPFPVAQSLSSPEARQFMPAMAAGNPVADPDRQTPVEELVAEGFGTATTVRSSPTAAHGAWREGKWTVVITRPLDPDDPLAAAIQSGSADAVALAVWDGSAANVGGRKHWSAWVPMKLISGSASR